MTPEERIAELEAENARQREQMAVLLTQNSALLERVQELEARLAKDSHNSSMPPSTEGLARKTKSLRRRSGKQPGGQLGHRGQTLRLAAPPDAVVEQRPTVCAGCHTPLDTAAAVVLRERRQVHDLPPLRLRITEHQALHVECPACQAVSVGVFPPEAPRRAQYGPRLRALAVYLVEQQRVPYARVHERLRDLFGVALSGGTLVAWVQDGRPLPPWSRSKRRSRRRCSGRPSCTMTRRGCAGQAIWPGRMSPAPVS
jgi:transposase